MLLTTKVANAKPNSLASVPQWTWKKWENVHSTQFSMHSLNTFCCNRFCSASGVYLCKGDFKTVTFQVEWCGVSLVPTKQVVGFLLALLVDARSFVRWQWRCPPRVINCVLINDVRPLDETTEWRLMASSIVYCCRPAGSHNILPVAAQK